MFGVERGRGPPPPPQWSPRCPGMKGAWRRAGLFPKRVGGGGGGGGKKKKNLNQRNQKVADQVTC